MRLLRCDLCKSSETKLKSFELRYGFCGACLPFLMFFEFSNLTFGGGFISHSFDLEICKKHIQNTFKIFEKRKKSVHYIIYWI